jgi:pimeloyl-ACP methyl ester carboxylesterase
MVPVKREWKDRVESLVDKYLIVTPVTQIPGNSAFKRAPPDALLDSFRGLFTAVGVLSVSYFGMSRGGMWGHYFLLVVPEGCMAKLASMVLVGGYATTGISMQSQIGPFIYP